MTHLIRILALVALLGCTAELAIAQKDDGHPIEGKWTGTITQDEGGYRAVYDVTVTFNVEGNQVTGTSYCAVDKIFVNMAVSGKILKDKFIKLEDTEILDSRIVEELQWCIKQYQLIYKPETETIDGFWQGTTSFGSCIPGKVHLKRKINRA